MSRKIQFEDKAKIENLNNGIREVKKLMEQFVQATGRLPLGRDLKGSATVAEFIRNPELGYSNLVKANLPDYELGIEVNKDERLKSLKMPDLSNIRELTELILSTCSSYNLGSVGDLFILEGNGSIKVNEAYKERLADNFRLYSTDSTSSNLIEKQKEFIKAYADLKGYSEKQFGAHNVTSVFDFNNFQLSKLMNQQGELNPQFSKTLMIYASDEYSK